MPFLTWIGNLFLNFIWSKLVAWVSGVAARLKRQKEVEKESQDSVQPLKDAKTADEIDQAARKSLDGF